MSRQEVRCIIFFLQAEDGMRYLVRSRGLGDVYKRQVVERIDEPPLLGRGRRREVRVERVGEGVDGDRDLSLIHI